MCTISKKEAERLLSIIPDNYPLMDIYHLTNHLETFVKVLEKKMKHLGYHYDLYIPEPFYTKITTEEKDLKIQQFDFKKQRYNQHAKQYDFVFIMIDIKAVENPALFYKKIYAIIKNGGKLFLILSQQEDLGLLKEQLIAYNYVAVNEIEDTFEKYHILSAQKMHGWGN